MWYRIVRAFKYKTAPWAPETEAAPGQMIDVDNRHEAKRLLTGGFIVEKDYPWDANNVVGVPAKSYTMTRRVGLWLQTSHAYSGGRLHLYQYALTLAGLGAEVWLITNRMPIWQRDYPNNPRLRILIEGKDKIPPDLDLVVTDSKNTMGQKAWQWKAKHPNVPFICFNFETPNWVAEFEPEYAKRLDAPKHIFDKADFLISNSRDSDAYLLKWLNKETPSGWLPPVVNTHALKVSENVNHKSPTDRPYAVYSARAPLYKGGRVVVESIWELDEPFDLVTIGQPGGTKIGDTALHRWHDCERFSDAEKYSLMRGASIILAPSKFEGYGMVPAEALACGTPVMVYDLPVLRWAHGDGPIYSKWGDKSAFKAKFKEVLADLPKHKAKAIAASATVKETHGLPAMAKQIEKLKFHAVKRPSVSAHCIAYWGFVPESIEAIYPHVDEIVIAYGPTHLNKDVPPDGSLQRIESLPDPDNKIKLLVRKQWQDKLEMRQWCTNRISGNWHMLLDGDEIWVGLDKWIKAKFPFCSPRWVNMWHSPDHWVYDSAKLCGRRWGKKLRPYGSVCPHYRWSWWRPSYRWSKHHTLQDFNGSVLHQADKIATELEPSCTIYHLGHALPREVMKAKHEFYRKRDGDDQGRKQRQEAWHNWKGATGDCGDGIIENTDWEVPEIVRRGYESLRG